MRPGEGLLRLRGVLPQVHPRRRRMLDVRFVELQDRLPNGRLGCLERVQPELCASKTHKIAYGSMVDVYAFGVMLCELLMHEVPWEHASVPLDAVMARVAERTALQAGRPTRENVVAPSFQSGL